MSIDEIIKELKYLPEKIEISGNAVAVCDFLKAMAMGADLLEELKAYQQLEADGRLVKLPLEAYCIIDFKIKKGFVSEVTYSLCRKPLLKVRCDDNSLTSHKLYLGNAAFLTKAEAEAKLAELRGGENE